MNETRSKYTIIFTILAFTIIVTILNLAYPVNGDELFHTNTAFSLLKWGTWDYKEFVFFDGGFGTDIVYTRGRFITLMTKWLMAIFGPVVFPLRLSSLVIALITLLSVLLIAKKESGDEKESLKAFLLTACSSFFILTAFNLRFYAPLILAALWGTYLTYRFFITKSVKILIGALVLIAIPLLDHWQNTHLSYIAIFTVVYFFFHFKISEKILKIKHIKIYFGVIVFILAVLTPFMPIFIDRFFMKVGFKMGSRAYMGYHHDYFDNFIGTARYLLAILPLMVFLPRFETIDSKKKFFALCAYTALIHGLFLGLWTPHNHIFFYRYFVVSCFFAILGYSFFVHSKLRYALFIIAHIMILSSEVLYNRPETLPIGNWLETNYTGDKSALVVDFDYHWNTKTTYPNTLPIRHGDKFDLKVKLEKLMKEKPIEKVYFFCEDPFFFRVMLYQIFYPEEERIAVYDITRYLIENHKAKDLFHYNSAHLYEFETKEFLSLLDNAQLTSAMKRRSVVWEVLQWSKRVLKRKKP